MSMERIEGFREYHCSIAIDRGENSLMKKSCTCGKSMLEPNIQIVWHR